jgi:hypothetical protein
VENLVTLSEVLQETNEAISNANSATSLATTAATNADNKANLANTATTNANNAASNANTKASLADTATTNANAATTAANSAATNANDKAAQANTAAGSANTAATNANEKATLANDAATNADQIANDIQDAEALRIDAEESRESQETIRQNNETTRQAQETTRQSQETSRVSAESSRGTAEANRISAETDRVSAESGRVTAESSRASAESSRESAEEGRESAEELRVTAESTRSSTESARISNENTRQTNETNRITAESDRVDAETSRVNAEGVRVAAEEDRDEAEMERLLAEDERIDAETTRASNETTRQSNETTRQSQENARETNTTNAIQAINEIKDSFVFKGEYSELTAYEINNQVSYNGTTYICIGDSTGNTPFEGSDYWAVYAKRGNDGTGTGTVTSVASSNSDLTIVNPTTDPVFSVNTTTAGGTEANKIAKTNSSGRVGDSEKLGGLLASTEATADTIIQRDEDGQAKVGVPTEDGHIARKQDVDAVASDLANTQSDLASTQSDLYQLTETVDNLPSIPTTAAQLPIVDPDNIYTGTNVETAFAEVKTLANDIQSKKATAYTVADEDEIDDLTGMKAGDFCVVLPQVVAEISNPTLYSFVVGKPSGGDGTLTASPIGLAVTFVNDYGETAHFESPQPIFTPPCKIIVGVMSLPTGATGFNVYVDYDGSGYKRIATNATSNVTFNGFTGSEVTANPPTVNTTSASFPSKYFMWDGVEWIKLMTPVDLSTATNSTATDKAATSSAVKSAYDIANAALPKSSVKTTVNSTSTTDAASSSSVKEAYDLAAASTARVRYLPDGTDINTITDSGFYRLGTSNINANGISWGQLLVVHGGGDTICQYITGVSDGKVYFRNGNPSNVGGSGSWSAWGEIWTSLSQGNTASLNTTSKQIVGAINELFTSASNGKAAVASAITGKGQSASGSDSYATLASKISAISNDADAGVTDVLSGKTFYQGGKKTGTMPNNGALGTVTPGTSNQSIPDGYTSGGTVAGDSNLVAGNISSGVPIFGVTGNAPVMVTGFSLLTTGGPLGNMSFSGSFTIPSGFTKIKTLTLAIPKCDILTSSAVVYGLVFYGYLHTDGGWKTSRFDQSSPALNVQLFNMAASISGTTLSFSGNILLTGGSALSMTLATSVCEYVACLEA